MVAVGTGQAIKNAMNGDGDVHDTHLRVIDTLGGPLPLLLGPAEDVAVHQGSVAFLRPESADGSLLNGDGDAADAVVHFWANRQVGPPANLQRAATAVALSADWIAALVPETGEGVGDLAASVPGGSHLDRLHALMKMVAERVAYVQGATHAGTTAEEALRLGSGVCQDHSHIFAATARKLGFPARYVSGYLMAFGVCVALARRVREGGSWLVRVALARVGKWIVDRGTPQGYEGLAEDLPAAELDALLGEMDAPDGRIRYLKPVIGLSETPPYFSRPPVPLGYHQPTWTSS